MASCFLCEYITLWYAYHVLTFNILQFGSVFCQKKKPKTKCRALRDKTAPLIMQICFGKWVQVMVFSLVWCVPQSTGNTHFQHAFPQRCETNLQLTTHTVFAAHVYASIEKPKYLFCYRYIQRHTGRVHTQ